MNYFTHVKTMWNLLQASATSPMRASSSSTATSAEKSPNPKAFECSDENKGQMAHSSVSVPPTPQCSSSDFHINEQATFLKECPPECFGTKSTSLTDDRRFHFFFYIKYVILFAGISDWDDFGILSQVLATSQQEYLESLKRQNNKDDICEQ